MTVGASKLNVRCSLALLTGKEGPGVIPLTQMVGWVGDSERALGR